MQDKFIGAGAFVCAAVLSLSLAGCGQQSSSSVQSASSEREQSVHNAKDPTANGRIDATNTGKQVATYHGAKYIVSDATADQTTDNMGLQEICVVRQPESWESISSIGWDRNSISYTRISMPWGEASYRYEYANDAGAPSEMQEWSRTNEQNYFSGMENVQHMDVDGRSVGYVFDSQSAGSNDMGIEDLEAQAMGIQEGTSGRTISVYTYEQRGDKCSLLITATYNVTNDAAFNPSAEQMVQEAYAPLEFAPKDANVDAASFLADLAITNAGGDRELTIKRNGSSLMMYAEHSVALLDNAQDDSLIPVMTFDFASDGQIPEGAGEYSVGGKTVRAVEEGSVLEGEEGAIEDRTVHAWLDVDGATLYVEASMKDGELVENTLARVLTDRIG